MSKEIFMQAAWPKQTWAKRGVQAALVTGGMLAAGSGAASASETCPNRPAPPLGESVSPANNLSRIHGVPCFAGELFPERELSGAPHEDAAATARSARHPITAMSGTLPAELSDRGRPEHITHPRIHSVPQHARVERPASHARVAPEDNGDQEIRIAGWIIDSDRPQHGHSLDTQVGEPKLLFGLLPTDGARHNRAASGTPAQGFHRSVSWSGPIGYVHDELADTTPNRALITPAEDPAVFGGFAETDSIVGLWQDTLGRELVTPETTDLTTVDPGEPSTKLHSVPEEVLNPLLSTRVPASADRKQDIIPLTVPGRHQLKVNEIPELRRNLALPPSIPTPETAERAASLDPSTPGEPDTLQPVVSNITRALEGNPAQPEQQPMFSRTPLSSEVRVTTVDRQLATTPVLELITKNPHSSGPRAATIPMNLPLAVLSDLTAQGETLPNIDIYGDMRHELEITKPLQRLPSQV